MSITLHRTRECPMDVYEEIFIDQNISLEAKAIIGILNTYEIRDLDMDKYLARFKIKNLDKLLNELEENNYIFSFKDTWSGQDKNCIAASGLKYSDEDKLNTIKRAVIQYIEITENNNRMEYSEEEKTEMIKTALSTFIHKEKK